MEFLIQLPVFLQDESPISELLALIARIRWECNADVMPDIHGPHPTLASSRLAFTVL